MHTFLFVHTNTPVALEKILATATCSISTSLPTPNDTPSIDTTRLPNSTIGWISARSATLKYDFFQEAVEPDCAALVFGKHDSVADGNRAQALISAWRNNGEDGIREMQADFSAIIVDRRNSLTLLFSDQLGNRSLMYHDNRGTFLASPHDLTLLATGEIYFDIDHEAVCGMLATGWSPGGRSLIKHVHRVQPYELLKRTKSAHVARPFGIQVSSTRIEPQDQSSIDANLDAMVMTFRDAIEHSAPENVPCQIALSAGIDSRAVFAALMAVHPKSNIEIVSSGGSASQDVRIAKRLAELSRIQFNNPPFERNSEKEFLFNARLFAFAMNGDLCEGGHLFQPLPSHDYLNTQPTVLFGDGGEIYAGSDRKGVAQAPYSLTTNDLGREITSKDAFEAILREKERKLNTFPWRDRMYAEVGCNIIRDALTPLQAMAQNGFDFLDLVYIYERMGVWGNTKRRMTWFSGYKSPYLDGRLFELAFRMPSPIGKYCHLQSATIRKYLERGLWIPINGERLVPGVGYPKVRRLADIFLKGGNRVRRRVKRGWSQKSAKPCSTVRASHADMLTGCLRDYVMETLTQNGSMGRELFGVSGVADLLQRRETKTIIALLIFEHWRRLGEEISGRTIDESYKRVANS